MFCSNSWLKLLKICFGNLHGDGDSDLTFTIILQMKCITAVNIKRIIA